MNRALWKKAVADAWLQAAASSVVLLLFAWLFVWLMSRFQFGAWARMLDLLPNFFQPMLGIPLAKLATPAGQVSVLFVHVVTTLVCIGWAVGRGSDWLSGEIGRGTMDLLLTLPIRRVTVMVIPAVVTTLGSAVLAGSVWLGMWLGLCTVDLGGNPPATQFVPGAINLFAMTFCLSGLTALISSWSRDRWRVILSAGGLFVVSLILKMVARMWPAGAWLGYFSFLTAFEPQRLILLPDNAPRLSLSYNGTLLAVGLASYLAAGAILVRRDIPAALS